MDKLLILDLDETLIKSYVIFEEKEKEENKEESARDFFTTKDETFKYKVYKRPLLKGFLEYCFNNFKVGIWSASDIRYINCILDGILTKEQKEKLHCIYSFDQCTKKVVGFQETSILKNLNKLWRNGSYNKTNTLVIDDTPTTYKNNIGNAIPIDKWDKDKIKDKELTRIIERLKVLKDRDDVRFPNRSEFKMD